MRKFFLLIMGVLMAGSIMAEDVMQVLPFRTQAGVTEDDEQYMSLQMVNTCTPTLLQMKIIVPEGMTLITDYIDLNPDRFDGITRRGVFYPNHTFDFSREEDGSYWLFIYDSEFSTVKGESGEVAMIYYETAPDMKPGTYPIIIQNALLGVDSKTGVYPEKSVSYVTVGEPAANSVVNLGEGLLVPSFVQEQMKEDGNVVVNGTCESLVLKDGADLVATSDFVAKTVSYEATVSESLGFKTLVLPYDCDVPSGFEAYEVQSVSDGELMMSPVSSLTAGVPVILKNVGTASMTAENVTIRVAGGGLENGELMGTYSAIQAPVGSYVLQHQSDMTAFFKVMEDKQPKVGPFRAYLREQPLEAKAMTLNFGGEVTSVEELTEEATGSAVVYYNLNGVRQNKAQRGVNIVRKGEKVMKSIIK